VRVVQKNVYYCEFCKRHRLTKNAIEAHEPRCIYNPGRVCRWEFSSGEHGQIDVAAVAVLTAERELQAEEDVVWLREQTDGCPACMLAAVVQSGLFGETRDAFDYKAEVERFRAAERETTRYQDAF